MEKPYSGHDFLLSPPPLKLDSSSFFPFANFPTFHHQVDHEGIVFGETDNRYSTTQEPAAASVKKISGRRRKRCPRTDRHSKICTAQGVRDRRMRLSLDVAPEFFEIQDMLGFDKASKTLRWLITAAKPAIQELVDGSSDQLAEEGNYKSAICDDDNIVPAKAKTKRVLSGRRPPSSRRAAATIARESRIKARERARERTEEKKSLSLFNCNSAPPLGADQLVAEVEARYSPDDDQCQLEQVTIFDYYYYNQSSSMCPNDLFHHEQWYMEEDMQLIQTPRLWEA